MTACEGQPDIDYYPNFENFQKRSRRNVEAAPLKGLPTGFPETLKTPAAWEPSIEQDESKWIFHVAVEEIEEVLGAMHYFEGLNLPFSHVCQERFPLPKFGPTLRSYSRQVHFGIGFFLLRGFPVDILTVQQRVIVFAGVSSYIGNVRARQDQGGAALSHVTDLTGSHKEAIGNPAFTSGAQSMHTDPGEIIGMFCLDVAAEGGESRIASTSTVYNCLAKDRPDLVATLSENWIFDGFGGNPKFTKRPILFMGSNDRIIVQFVRRAFTGFRNVPRSFDIPPISEAQAEAIDALHFIGMEKSIQVKFLPGDFQFLNNLNLLHARDAFRDDEKQKRHLLRIWLRDDEYGWSIPDALAKSTQWQRLFELKMEDQWFPLEPQVKSEKFEQEIHAFKSRGVDI